MSSATSLVRSGIFYSEFFERPVIVENHRKSFFKTEEERFFEYKILQFIKDFPFSIKISHSSQMTVANFFYGSNDTVAELFATVFLKAEPYSKISKHCPSKDVPKSMIPIAEYLRVASKYLTKSEIKLRVDLAAVSSKKRAEEILVYGAGVYAQRPDLLKCSDELLKIVSVAGLIHGIRSKIYQIELKSFKNLKLIKFKNPLNSTTAFKVCTIKQYNEVSQKFTH